MPQTEKGRQNIADLLKHGGVMSIKKRLIISYIAMILIPTIILIISTFFAGKIINNILKNVYNVGFYGQPVENIIEKDSIAINNIKNYISSHKKALENTDFFQKQEKYLSDQTGIIIRKNDDLVYVSPFLKNEVKQSVLPKFGEYEDASRGRSFGENKFMILKQNDFYIEDGNKISIFLFLNTSSAENIAYSFFIAELIILLVIFILTSTILTFLMSKSIVKPLEKLKDGAVLIKNGNLDFELNASSSDEIGQLSIAFEEMRIRLKKSLEVQLQYENNRKELISNISHDLKTPITAIKGYIEGIKDGIADTPEKMDKYINTIYIKAIDLDKLIDELFLFSKLDLKKLPFNFEKVDILNYLRDCIEELKFDLDKKNINIILECSLLHRIYVTADREKLKRVIMNIIENSVKYMDKKMGEISIKIVQDKEFCIISFKDNGIGISKEAIPYVFDRFYRADSSRNSKTGGSGLGLAISKRIIEEHGGNIWAESDGNKGTNIIIKLRKWGDDYGEKHINS
jgi:histidine kinase